MESFLISSPFRAYIKTDPHEDPEVLTSLVNKLVSQGLLPILTSKNWKDIWEPFPFLYFRNPYIRIDNERAVVKLHLENTSIPYITTLDKEIVSVSSTASLGSNAFVLNQNAQYYEPKIEPLPILMGTNSRPLYFRLTLNSLLSNIKSSRQKIYIVVSQPDAETKKIVEDSLQLPNIEAVLSEENLKYSFANFGSKFFGLKKFIHCEDDGIFPENTSFHLPFWTSQLNHRSKTADLVTFRIFEGNWMADFLKSDLLYRRKPPRVLQELWNYFKPQFDEILPVGGMGMVIDSDMMYKGFNPPNYNASDKDHILGSRAVCLINIPIYHIGVNYRMDYPAYSKNKADTGVNKTQVGTDMRTKQIKKIDLSVDFKDGGVLEV